VGDTNTIGGLTEGDINASIIYYDTLVAKSPAIICSGNKCKVEDIENELTYYVTKDDDWNLVGSTSGIPNKIKDKFKRLKDKKEKDKKKEDCEALGEFNYYDEKHNRCEINFQAQCEVVDWRYYDNEICKTNPLLECDLNQPTKSWNYNTMTCENDLSKSCELSEGYIWNIETNVCEFSLEEYNMIQAGECMNDRSKIWNVNINSCLDASII